MWNAIYFLILKGNTMSMTYTPRKPKTILILSHALNVYMFKYYKALSSYGGDLNIA